MFKSRFLAAAMAAIAAPLFAVKQGSPRNLGQRYQQATTAGRRKLDPDPSLSRQQRRYAERLAAKRAKYSDAVRRNYLIPLPA